MALASSTCATAGSPATDTGAIEPHQNRPAMLEGCQAFIAGAPAMRAAIELIARTAPSTANVLITGEYGSGRRTVARAIHVGSPHALQPFVTIRPEAIVEYQFEADLFGGGADNPDSGSDATIGLLERADGGTLFIGEIAAIPQALQPRLLRAIETGEFERAGGSCTHRTNVRVLS